MNAKEFFDLVVSMRQAQIKYFRSRSSVTLREAKILEDSVDQEILRVQELLHPTPKEGDLFKKIEARVD